VSNSRGCLVASAGPSDLVVLEGVASCLSYLCNREKCPDYVLVKQLVSVAVTVVYYQAEMAYAVVGATAQWRGMWLIH